MLPGAGPVVGQRFVTHPAVRKVVFTGSTRVGKQIMAGCAEQVKRVTLELGGKNANIVFADADLEKAAATAPYGVFDNAGQDCCARSRILVERSAYDEFLGLLDRLVGDRDQALLPGIAQHKDVSADLIAQKCQGVFAGLDKILIFSAIRKGYPQFRFLEIDLVIKNEGRSRRVMVIDNRVRSLRIQYFIGTFASSRDNIAGQQQIRAARDNVRGP